ncbi:MAG: DNA polymerase III subunit beta [Patescibacteria group bacterium]|nr:DNA polymerase III subunit beta [Patescibacteria group bacterium]
MKFTCKTINLRNAILKVERIVSRQTTLPILSNILLSTDKGRIVISATNLEIAIKAYIGAKIEKEGKITIPPRILGGFLNTITDEVITGNLLENELKINSENHKIKIKGINAKDFPIIPNVPASSFISVDLEAFTQAVSGILISVARNDTRQELNGVFMRFGNKSLTLAATDSFRLTEVKTNLINVESKNEYKAYKEKMPSVIIPSLAFTELQRITDEGALYIMVDQNQLFLSTKTTKIISRLINGNYPEYEQVLPKKYDITIKVEKEELIKALKIASLITNNPNGEVLFQSSKDGKNLTLKAQSIDTGDNISTITANINGPEFEVLFNCRYLLEGLNSVLFNQPFVELKLNKQKSPVLLQNAGSEENTPLSFSYVIMPIIKG